MNTSILKSTLIASITLNAGLIAAPTSFDFKDPKGVNQISFNLDAPLEAISGTANGVSGTISFDPENPDATTGTITVDATTLIVPNNSMQDHMHGEGWLDTATHGEISFEAADFTVDEASDKKITGTVTGTFTLKGVSREISAPVTLTYLPGKLGARTNGQMEGDLLVLRSTFTINRSEYGIKPGQNTDKVAEEIVLSMAIAGYSPKG